MRRILLACAVLAGTVLVATHGMRPGGRAVAAEAGGEEQLTDPMGPNAACYVCHMTFVREELSRTHLAAKVTCIKCHGLSAKHANDEDIGATKPDRIYERDKVNAMCRPCHETHNVPAEDVIARWLERKLTQAPPVCTDCHGAHRIERPEETEGE